MTSTVDPTQDLHRRAEQALRDLAGPDVTLRPDQWRAIEALLVDERRVLVVQRTGWGKSAVYFAATKLLREQGAGPTVIVSPLLALMRNQIDAAARAGIRAHTINSANIEEWDEITAQLHSGNIDVLLISPERLNNPDFRDNVLPKLAAITGLLVIDEAHCISDWGHDFRPDYRRIRTFLGQLSENIPVLATTATANARVVTDISEQLELSQRPTLVLRGPLERESLRLAVLPLPTSAHRLAWLDEHLNDLTGSGIIYTLTVAAADEISSYLLAQGHKVAPYTGRMETAERQQIEAALLNNEIKAVIATSALGMGYDKPDLGFVINFGSPQSPIGYYQQIGRAGRAVKRADVLLMPGHEDEAIWKYFASLTFPGETQVRQTLSALEQFGGVVSTALLETKVDLQRSRLEAMLKVLDVDGAVRRVRGGWEATGQSWTYDRQRYERITQARRDEQQAMRNYATGSTCRMRYLRQHLDDEYATDCGRCDNCTGEKYSAHVTGEALAKARGFLVTPGVQFEPRKLWPQGLKEIDPAIKGRIPASELAEKGRALGRLSDVGWGNQLRPLFAPGTPDVPVTDEVFAALVEMLAAWAHDDQKWETRPVGVVTVPSRTRGQLIADLGSRLAQVGQLPYLGQVVYRNNDPASYRGNSAQRVRGLYSAFTVPPELISAISNVGGPILLVDDRVDSGWTMTLVSRLLRQHGALQVLPLALALEA